MKKSFPSYSMVFFEDVPKQLEALKAFVTDGNATDIERQAHTIKGAAATVGAERLRAIACIIEHAAEARNLQEVHAHMVPLQKAFECLKQSMLEE